MKRLFSIVLTICLVLGMFPIAVFAAESTVPEGLTYYNYGTYIEIASYTGTESELKIPRQIDGLPVTRIGYLFQNCPTLTRVILPETLEYIYPEAFTGFPKLEMIAFANGNAYYEAREGVLFSQDRTELLKYPAAKQGSYTVPSSVTYISPSAFSECTGLTALELPEGYSRKLDNYMFAKCCNLQEITIPAGVTEINDLAFQGCSSLTSIKVDENNTTYRSIDGVLFNKDGTALLIFPGGISGHYVIPENVKIAKRAFYDQNGLTKVTISNHVDLLIMDGTECWGYIFYNSPLLTEIEADPAHPQYSSSDGILYNKDGTSLMYCPRGKSGIVAVPDGVTTIGLGAFMNYREITGVVLPASLQNILPAFTGSSILTDVYYAGTEEQWSTVNIETSFGDVSSDYYGHGNPNQALLDATMHYNKTSPFDDVHTGSFFYGPVLWAVSSGVTTGASATSFGPKKDCTRGQVVTFLWRAAGSPKPTVTEHPFTDVKEGAYYYDAMLWAVENGITNGTTSTTFGPGKTCTRGQVVTFLHRALNKPAPASTEHPFTDVQEGKYYYTAMLWAVENGITNGTSKNAFGPDKTCNRGQVVTFLYRAYAD